MESHDGPNVMLEVRFLYGVLKMSHVDSSMNVRNVPYD